MNNFSVYDKTPNSCLASRFPHGSELTLIKLRRIENSERAITTTFESRNIRVRDHGDLARIELDSKDFAKFLNPEIIQEIVMNIKKYGYKYVTLDLEGYRSNKNDPSIDLELNDQVPV